MILDFIFGLFHSMARFVIDFLPDPETLPSAIDSAFTAAIPYWAIASHLFPIDTLLVIFLLIMGIEFSIVGFQILNFIFNKIRGAG